MFSFKWQTWATVIGLAAVLGGLFLWQYGSAKYQEGVINTQLAQMQAVQKSIREARTIWEKELDNGRKLSDSDLCSDLNRLGILRRD